MNAALRLRFRALLREQIRARGLRAQVCAATIDRAIATAHAALNKGHSSLRALELGTAVLHGANVAPAPMPARPLIRFTWLRPQPPSAA